jgi:hypothetical protein
MDDVLRLELLRRVELDRRARNALTRLFDGSDRVDDSDPLARRLIEHNVAVDHDNTAWLRCIVEARGWPTVTMVGSDGENAAWLLAQHADHDTGFQQRCLALMTTAPVGEVHARHVAYLIDRVLLANGQAQIYGTQVHLANGQWQARNLDDPEHVDVRRQAVGLDPWSSTCRGSTNRTRIRSAPRGTIPVRVLRSAIPRTKRTNERLLSVKR